MGQLTSTTQPPVKRAHVALMLFHLHARKDGTLWYEACNKQSACVHTKAYDMGLVSLDFDQLDTLYRRMAREEASDRESKCVIVEMLKLVVENYRAPDAVNRLWWIELESESELEAFPLRVCCEH